MHFRFVFDSNVVVRSFFAQANSVLTELAIDRDRATYDVYFTSLDV